MAHRFVRIHAQIRTEGRDEVVARLSAAGREVCFVDDADLETVLGDVEVLVGSSLPRVDWSRARKLRFLQMLGSGIDPLWPATGLAEQVEIANTRGIHLPEMRDHV